MIALTLACLIAALILILSEIFRPTKEAGNRLRKGIALIFLGAITAVGNCLEYGFTPVLLASAVLISIGLAFCVSGWTIPQRR